jgi:hypothetical protein
MLPKPVAELVHSPEAEVDSALSLLDNIRQVATDQSVRPAILPLVQRLGVRIGLRFVGGIGPSFLELYWRFCQVMHPLHIFELPA